MCTPQNAAVIKDSFGVRRLTLRESLKFQGFPKDYYFPKTIDIQSAYKQIGNSLQFNNRAVINPINIPIIRNHRPDISFKRCIARIIVDIWWKFGFSSCYI